MLQLSFLWRSSLLLLLFLLEVMTENIRARGLDTMMDTVIGDYPTRLRPDASDFLD